FHIVREPRGVPFDGRNRYDFLKNSTNISYEKNELRLKSFQFPLKIYNNSNPYHNSIHFLAPRSETVIEIEVLNPEIKEGRKAVVTVNDNKALTTILNTTDQKVKIDNVRVKLENLDNIRSDNSIIPNPILTAGMEIESRNRLELLRDNLRLKHLNSEEKNCIEEICKQFNDIFHLPGDDLSFPTAIKHEIITKDPTPIVTKIYRLPKIHEEELEK
ncbi:hypothetical protein BDFB_013447, partial [Asbolus verrucosus]